MTKLATIVAGSRTINSYSTVKKAIQNAPFEIEVLLSGTAEGVDNLAEDWATNEEIPIQSYDPDDYQDSPRPAPIERNQQMALDAEALIAVWNGTSNGTEDMIERAQNEDLQIHIHRTDTKNLDDFL